MPNPNGPTGKPVNRYVLYKQVGKGSLTTAGLGIQVAQYATGSGMLALAAAGAAASATGIGLVVTGAALTLGTAGLSAVSAHKSRLHRNALEKIAERKKAYACSHFVGDTEKYDIGPHLKIADVVLPYLVEQKGKKFVRKAVGATPGLGMLETIRAVGKKAYKAASGSLGTTRGEYAGLLAAHLIAENCGLAQAIVAELYSYDEMLWLMNQEYDKIVELLMPKLKST